MRGITFPALLRVRFALASLKVRGARMPIPIRSCIACRKRTDWHELLRVVLIEDQVTPDPDRKKSGRGAWLHRNCFDLAKERRSFQRAFRTDKPLRIEPLEIFIKGN